MKTYVATTALALFLIANGCASHRPENPAAQNAADDGSMLPKQVQFHNKTTNPIYVWHFINDKASCNLPATKLVVAGDQSKAMSYVGKMYVRVTTSDDSCSSPTLAKWVGDQAETIDIP